MKKFCLRFLYEAGLICIWLAFLPNFLYQVIFKKKYRLSFFKRLGFSFPAIEKNGRTLVWVHAVSLGETKAVGSLIKAIKLKWDNPIILLSTATETGYAEACRQDQADYHVYLPFDFSWIIKRLVRRVAPDVVLLCESDFWLNFLQTSKEVGAKVALVNGKISLKSMNRLLKIPFFTEMLYEPFDLFCVQSELYADRFLKLGVSSEKIFATGNLKFDGHYPKLSSDQLVEWRRNLGVKEDDLVVVIGSTHAPEETWIMQAMSKVWEKFPALKVILVPRHPERFNEVASLLKKSKIGFRRYSQDASIGDESVILMDAMGQLLKCYQLADVAIVAGSYAERIGGHNIMEPCSYGVPVIFGPYMHGQPALVQLMLEYHAGIDVPIEKLGDELIDLLSHPNRRKALASGGLRLSKDVHGSTEKTLEVLSRFFYVVKK